MGAMLIIGGKGFKKGMPERSSSEESEMDDESGVSSDEAKREAAKALIRAVKMGDVDAVTEALDAHYEACGE
jgi:hypothetical protein